MKTSSAKAKGRRLQQWVAKKISDVLNIPCGKDELIESREMGQTGVDVKLYGEAKEKYPYSIETKNTETWQLPATIRQVKTNIKKGTTWQIFLSKNHYDPVMIMDAEDWFKLYNEYLILKYKKQDND